MCRWELCPGGFGMLLMLLDSVAMEFWCLSVHGANRMGVVFRRSVCVCVCVCVSALCACVRARPVNNIRTFEPSLVMHAFGP